MARFLRSFLPRVLYHNTVCSSTAPHLPFSSLLPATFHLRNFSEGNLACGKDTKKSVERLRNIWISGLLSPRTYPMDRHLFYSGRIKEFHEQSKKYQILASERTGRTRQLALTYTSWNHHKIYIIDTLHRVDFHIDVQRALHFVDGAILVLCGVRGVQRESATVDQLMKGYEIPRLVFIDNLDQKGANPWVVLDETRSKLGHHSAVIQVPIGLEGDFKGFIDLVQLKAYSFHGDNVVAEEVPADMEALVLDKRRELIETVSEVDDKLAEAFRTGKTISSTDLEEAVRRATIARIFIPVLMGSAFKKGPQPLLDGVLRYLPCPIEVTKYSLNQTKNGEKLHGSLDGPLVASAVTFNISLLDRFFKTYLRIYEGVLRKGDCIVNVRTGEKKWVHRLFVDGDMDIQEAHAGHIISVYGDDEDDYAHYMPFSAPGDTFIHVSATVMEPPLNVRENVSKDFKEMTNSRKVLFMVNQNLIKLLSEYMHEE